MDSRIALPRVSASPRLDAQPFLDCLNQQQIVKAGNHSIRELFYNPTLMNHSPTHFRPLLGCRQLRRFPLPASLHRQMLRAPARRLALRPYARASNERALSERHGPSRRAYVRPHGASGRDACRPAAS